MCRALIYLGETVLIDDLLFKPDISLVNQAYMPKMLHMLNLAGFGMMAWDARSHDEAEPWRYRSPSLPIFDGNLKSLATKARAECVIAHVRGVAYSTAVHVNEQNTHPFRFSGAALAMAHNGDIYRIGEMKGALVQRINPSVDAPFEASVKFGYGHFIGCCLLSGLLMQFWLLASMGVRGTDPNLNSVLKGTGG